MLKHDVFESYLNEDTRGVKYKRCLTLRYGKHVLSFGLILSFQMALLVGQLLYINNDKLKKEDFLKKG